MESKKELESELSALDKISSKKNAELANYNDNIGNCSKSVKRI